MSDSTPRSFDAWIEKYHPIKNPHVEHAQGDCGWELADHLFETYGAELAAVDAADPNCVWTMVEGEDIPAESPDEPDHAAVYVVSGKRHVNRLGYFITQNGWEGDGVYEVSLD